jgi:ribosomal protein S18 acetylase RimI-like enzyme
MDQDYTEVLAATESWLASIGHAVVGVVVTRSHADHLLIENIAVLPTAQGCGVGSQLLNVAEDHAAEQGLHEVRLYTNEAMTENLAFYPRHGYREVERAEQDGFRRVFFTKTVPGPE